MAVNKPKRGEMFLMKKITLYLTLVLVLILTIVGCAKDEDFALKVNNKPVPMKVYNEKLEAIKSYLTTQGIDFESEQGKAAMESVKNDILEGLIGTELISQEIDKNKWNLEDPEITKQIDELKKQLPDDDYDKWLKQQAMTEEEVIEYFAFTNNVSKDVEVTDAEIKRFFDSNFTRYGGQEEQVKARHILVATEEEALAVMEELKAGADFAELAKEKSTEPAAKTSGGDLGYFTRGQMLPAFEEAAFSQEEDKISEKPIQTSYGFHVILVEDHKQAVKPDFEKVKESVAKDALDFAEMQKVQSYYSKLRQDAKIDYAEELKPKNA